MRAKQALPIGVDDFRKIREEGHYYVDKTLMIKDFLELKDEVALIARPRRFGKTLNMGMIRDFFDITQDSQEIFAGLKIMNTEYAEQINSRPVIYLTFRGCKGNDPDQLLKSMKDVIYKEYLRHEVVVREQLAEGYEKEDFYRMIETLRDRQDYDFDRSLQSLTEILKNIYGIPPILLIDEYDQPVMSSYEYGYHNQIGNFFSNLYGNAMKSNPALGRALLTGVQRVAKESIFSQFNNAVVYTVLDAPYAPYFGLTDSETQKLLEDYGMELNEAVQKKYNGYRFGNIQMYNPWSILYYAKMGVLKNYWINTSSNALVKQVLEKADQEFWRDFDRLAAGEAISIWLTLETSFVERYDNYSVWGLLVNAGYLTALKWVNEKTAIVKIPNEEVLSEFQMIVASIAGVRGVELEKMFACLLKKDMDEFITIYRQLVISSTSYMDAKENAYHMLFLGMCMTLRGAYKVSSNIESGHGRSDVLLESLHSAYSHMIIEFKQCEEEQLEAKAQEALKQIKDKKYYAALDGEVICVGLAHDKKRCEMVYEVVNS